MTTRSESINLGSTSGKSASGYSSLARSGGNPIVPTKVLSPYQAAYSDFTSSFRQGLLNPHQGSDVASYYSITKAYSDTCSLGSKYYATRSQGTITP